MVMMAMVKIGLQEVVALISLRGRHYHKNGPTFSPPAPYSIELPMATNNHTIQVGLSEIYNVKVGYPDSLKCVHPFGGRQK